ncbi:acetylglutamate kinase [Helicobacter sp. 10-6591]|uniref:acetylglutamate kinase n=1 Tax=Helicobacter sp. 10-6591 TaxID=2004998 RepID=UPI000DCDA9A3|nr:acetylglutamate kinase [Helicobacter sp. 10-6591]RAX55580.1 acetylglutamate kinase [Helicobacter sp. 10-6591]
MQNLSAFKTHAKVAQILLESIPFIREFRGNTIVIKYGGSAQITPELKESFALDLVLLYMVGIKPIVIHGGGKRINEMLERLHIESVFKNGYRITSKECMDVVEMVLSGEINKELSAFLNLHGAKAVGLSGKDGLMLQAKKKDNGAFGYTGEITKVQSELLHKLMDDGFIPVIAPIAVDIEQDKQENLGLNINADIAACEIAKALNAQKVIFLTDTAGVLDKQKNLLSSLNPEGITQLKKEGTISGGMIPKLEACVECVESSVQKAHIIDGRIKHSLLLELFTKKGIGTQILK